MRPLVLLVLVFSFLIPATGQCGLFSGGEASLSEPAMTDQVDETTQGPLRVKEVFSPETGTIYATIKLSDAPKKTEVKALFFMVGDEERQIAEDSMVTNGTGYLSFSLDGPPSGWPLSRYKVVFLLNGQQTEELAFSVEDDSAEATSSQAATDPNQSATGFKTFKDPAIGFSFELPDRWQFYVEPASGNYIFSGPPETVEEEITIIIQIIHSEKGGQTDLKLEMTNLAEQVEAMDRADILKKDQIEISGAVAPFFLATYPAKDKLKSVVEFGHSQVGVENDPYILLISYAAPREIYQEKVAIFQHMMDTAQLFEPEN